MAVTDAVLVMTTLSDVVVAEALAARLVEARLAACVQVLPSGQSFYVWEGVLQREAEWMLLIKTTRERYPELEARLCAWHPYDLPEILALPVVAGSAAYLDWLRRGVGDGSDAGRGGV